ncbi:MAG: DNA cytosine methyltransferase [Candidatus Shapirobacteria bacterium]|nr:DNA cytosine methyltransferase [Candidatus Shapirobacteria bacterium]
MKKNYNAISLFTGAMGLDLGIEAAGFNVLACVENDKFCIETIRKNRPNIKLYDKDINIVDPAKILSDLNLKAGDIDLVVGGPPCQPFSTAGKRRGLEDFRGNVIIRFLDYVKTIKPKYFILENVRGIYYAKLSVAPPEYKDYKNIIDLPGSVIYFLYKEFTKLGYAVSFNLFDSSLYSVPQKRERFLMFGSRDGGVIKIPHPTTANHPKTLRDAIGKIQQQHQDFVKLREVHLKYLKRLKSGQYWKNLPEELQEEAMGKSYKLQGGKTGFYRRLSWDIPSPTLVTYPAMPATMLVHPDELRPLSIQEYAQIQQFPNKWEISGNITKIYKQIGNAVPVGLGKMAGLAIINHIEENNTQKEYDGETSRYNRTSYKEFIKDF